MTRIKLIKDHTTGKAGDVFNVTPNIAHGLIDSGIAILSKDMNPTDYKTKKPRKRKKAK